MSSIPCPLWTFEEGLCKLLDYMAVHSWQNPPSQSHPRTVKPASDALDHIDLFRYSREGIFRRRLISAVPHRLLTFVRLYKVTNGSQRWMLLTKLSVLLACPLFPVSS